MFFFRRRKKSMVIFYFFSHPAPQKNFPQIRQSVIAQRHTEKKSTSKKINFPLSFEWPSWGRGMAKIGGTKWGQPGKFAAERWIERKIVWAVENHPGESCKSFLLLISIKIWPGELAFTRLWDFLVLARWLESGGKRWGPLNIYKHSLDMCLNCSIKSYWNSLT